MPGRPFRFGLLRRAVLLAVLAGALRPHHARAQDAPEPRSDTLGAVRDTATFVASPPRPHGFVDSLAVAADGGRGTLPDTVGVDGPPPRKRVAVAVEQVMLSNVVVNLGARAFGGELKRDMEFSFATWTRNLRLGWTWDEEGFVVNMFGHPYQGAMYFNAGRHNGLSYWESVPLVVLGSWTWEYLGESLRPSLNDFFTTTLSGVAFGEMSYRLSRVLRDETATGRERWVRELGAALVNPVGAANRVLRGDAWRVGTNPPGRFPPAFSLTVDAGARLLWERSAKEAALTPTVAFDVAYGDPFVRPFQEPFDVFSARGQLSTGGYGLEFLQTTGRLWQRTFVADGPLHLALLGSQRFDYAHNPSYSFGGQSFEAGLVGRYTLRPGLIAHGRVGASGFVLSGVSAPPVTVQPGQPVPRRTYDFGPGLGAVLDLNLRLHGVPIVQVRSQAELLHTVSGTPADHQLVFAELRAALPVARGFGAGLHLSRDSRTSAYTSRDDIARASSQVLAFVTWTNARRPVRR